MPKNKFSFECSIAFLTSVDVLTKWWQFSKTIKLDLPKLNDADVSSIATIQNLNNTSLSFEITSIKKQFIDSKEGRQYIDSYLAQLKKMSVDNLDYLKTFANEFIRYSLDIIVENPTSHANPVFIEAYEFFGISQLLNTARTLKNAEFSGKQLVLFDETDENSEEVVFFVNYCLIDKDNIEMRYTDWDAEDEAEAEKVHTANFDSKPFVSQFNTTAHNIADVINKICRALGITAQQLEKSNVEKR